MRKAKFEMQNAQGRQVLLYGAVGFRIGQIRDVALNSHFCGWKGWQVVLRAEREIGANACCISSRSRNAEAACF